MRQDRKNRTDIEYKGCGGIFDAYDDAVKGSWYINDVEYDYICEKATDKEMDLFCGGNGKFSDLKKALKVIDNLLDRMYKST